MIDATLTWENWIVAKIHVQITEPHTRQKMQRVNIFFVASMIAGAYNFDDDANTGIPCAANAATLVRLHIGFDIRSRTGDAFPDVEI